MLLESSSAETMTLPTMPDLVLRMADSEAAPEPFLMETDEIPLMVLESKMLRAEIVVSATRLVYKSSAGGMMGKRFETFSLRLSQINAFITRSPGGLTGEAEVKLLVAGIGEISLGFNRETDISPFVALLTARAGRPA